MIKGKTKIIELELTEPLRLISGLADYQALWVLVRLHYVPLGLLKLELKTDCLSATALRRAIVGQFNFQILEHLLADGGFEGLAELPQMFEKLAASCPYLKLPDPAPLVSLAICTRNRAESLARTLDSVSQITYPNFEVIVIDNAPDDERTAELLTGRFPHFRYVREPRPGLDNARNRAIREASGEIVAFTDDDTVVDAHWLTALTVAFDSPDVMCVTGLVVPYELDHPAQQLFENYGGFTRGFKQHVFHYNKRHSGYFYMYGAGRFGTGANMAFRRTLFDQIGLFDPALDVGTVTNGGGDLDIYFRTLMEQHTLVFEPAALVWHVHRADSTRLHYQINGWGTGHAAFLTAALLRYPKHSPTALHFSWNWFKDRLLMRMFKESRRRQNGLFPLIVTETKGAVLGPFRYFQARRQEKRKV